MVCGPRTVINQVIAMLRITANDSPRALTFRLEGRLEGPWVRELERCWRSMLNGASGPTVCVDLTGVTYIDAAGKASLAEMYDQGAQFIAGDCVTKALVDEIVEIRSNPLVLVEENLDDTRASESNSADWREPAGL